jgi:hypothetical protein
VIQLSGQAELEPRVRRFTDRVLTMTKQQLRSTG